MTEEGKGNDPMPVILTSDAFQKTRALDRCFATLPARVGEIEIILILHKYIGNTAQRGARTLLAIFDLQLCYAASCGDLAANLKASMLLFRHIAQKFLDIRRYACKISVQSAENICGTL